MAIDVAAQIRYWRDGSSEDLEAAHTLLNAGKIRHAGFFMHLAIEKAIKSRVVAATSDLPPRSHDLLFLLQRAAIDLSTQQREFLGRVQVYCLEGRYPAELPPTPTKETIIHDLQQATEIIQCLIA